MQKAIDPKKPRRKKRRRKKIESNSFTCIIINPIGKRQPATVAAAKAWSMLLGAIKTLLVNSVSGIIYLINDHNVLFIGQCSMNMQLFERQQRAHRNWSAMFLNWTCKETTILADRFYKYLSARLEVKLVEVVEKNLYRLVQAMSSMAPVFLNLNGHWFGCEDFFVELNFFHDHFFYFEQQTDFFITSKPMTL